MTKETPADGGQQSVELVSFNSALTNASTAFAGEYHSTAPSALKPMQLADSYSAHLPPVISFDSGAGGHLSSPSSGPPAEQDLAGRIVKTIGVNEGNLTRITKNDNGHGISVGIRQCNQEVGELPNLLKSMHDKNPQKFAATFGPYAKDMLHENWVRHADMAGNPDLLKRMSKALHDTEFQQVQIDKAKQFAEKAIDMARKYGLKTEQGAALVADVMNQLGEGGARRVLRRAGLHPDHPVVNEQASLALLEHHTHRPNSRARFNTVASNFSDGALINKHRPTADASDLI